MTAVEQSRPAATDDELAGLRAVLAALPAPPADAGDDEQALAAGRAYLGALAADGWKAPGWPRRWGGRDASAAEAGRISALLRGHPTPDLYPFFVGLHMIGETLLAHGDDAQRDRWLPGILTGSDVWCQMFSEPGAGSDLANVGMRATRTDTGWLLDGQKVWTSRASYAGWALCLARTDPEVPKHQGMSMFVVPMAAPGVTVRPLVQMNGDRHFSEVFLDQVALPADHQVGGTGAGWQVAMTVLAHERASIASSGKGSRRDAAAARDRVPGWLRGLARAGQLGDPVRRDRAVAVFVEAEVARLAGARAAALARSGASGSGQGGSGHGGKGQGGSGRPGAGGSGQKLRLAHSLQARAQLIKELHGADGMLTEHRGHQEALTAPSLSIRGGTDEIQRNIVGERILGLPAEPRTDRDVPWSVSRRGLA